MRTRWVAERKTKWAGVRFYARLQSKGRTLGGVIRHPGERTWEAYISWHGPTKAGFTRRCEAKRWVEAQVSRETM